jgi:hypothetical protein
MADPSTQDPSGPAGILGFSHTGAENAGVGILSSPLDPALLPKLGGALLLDQLALQSPSTVAKFVAEKPSALRAMLANPPAARYLTSWWAGLPAATQKSLVQVAPGYVGNLDGVPFAVRDTANRRYLSQSIATLKATISSGVGRAQLVAKRHHLDVLNQVQRTLAAKAGEPKRQLVTFDPTGEARAAVAVGDLSTADYVSYLVPGMFFTVDGQMYDWTVIAADLNAQQTSWLKRLAKADPTAAGKTAATVAWLGYQTPGVLDIASLARADQGAGYLGNAIQGIDATRAGHKPFVTLVTHSYGSTTAMIELAKGGVSVDALAMIGSPGSATQSASKLAVRNDNVYVGEAAWDPVVNTAFYGSDPGTAAFGAHKMSVGGGTDAITHKPLGAAVGHLGYFDPGSEAMRNLALIGIDEGSLVTDGSYADAGRTLASAR